MRRCARTPSLFLFFSLFRRPPCSTLFPYTTLFRSLPCHLLREFASGLRTCAFKRGCGASTTINAANLCQDRKSTRLNSSHSSISYAVFCLKKKTHSCLTYAYVCFK